VLGYTCQLKQVAEDVDDWSLAGGLRGQAVELVQCKTIDLLVPAYAEFVIEIEVDFTTERPEGPLGEYSGYFTEASNKPVCRVKAITHRQDPLFQVLLAGKPVGEVHMLKNIPFEASFLSTLKQQFPTISAVSIRPSGGVQLFVVLAIKQRYAGEARQAIMNVMSSNIRPKWVIAVDPDIDVYDSADVEWAVSFRTVPGRDVFIVNNVPSAPLDPSSTNPEDTKNRLNSTVGIDATEPFDGSYPAVADVPGWQTYDFPELDKL
jgi:4-hydroxy-3-polyprenylbenzoate decarboxylase/2,5-furandicarboxylate decarboxylase 1